MVVMVGNFAVIQGLTFYMIQTETGIDSLSYATLLCFVLGLGLAAPAAPLKCKVYTAALGVSYYFATTGETDYWMIAVYWSLAVFVKRLIVLVMTAKTSFPASYIFGFISNIMPAYYFSRYDFFRADAAPEEIVARREKAFDELQAKW